MYRSDGLEYGREKAYDIIVESVIMPKAANFAF
jgi:hypothetical protein